VEVCFWWGKWGWFERNHHKKSFLQNGKLSGKFTVCSSASKTKNYMAVVNYAIAFLLEFTPLGFLVVAAFFLECFSL
jgi:hypothetical protein